MKRWPKVVEPELNAVDAEAHDFGRLGLGAEGRENGVQRAHPAQRVGANRGLAPAHGFGPGEAFDDGGDDLGEKIDRRGAGTLDHRDIELALLGVLLDRRLIQRGEAGAFEKALNRRLGRADARALFFLASVGLAGGQAGDVQREPARRRETRRALIDEPARDQRVGDEPTQIRRRLRLHAGGDFLGEKFKQKIGHGLGLLKWEGPSSGPCFARATFSQEWEKETPMLFTLLKTTEV